MSAVVRSISEFYLESNYATFDQEHRHGGSFGVDMIAVDQEAHEFVDPAGTEERSAEDQKIVNTVVGSV